MYVNKTLLDKAGLKVPQTITQLKTFCKQATAKGYIPMAFGDNPGWQAFHQFSMVANNMVGPQPIQQILYNNKGKWDTPEITRAITIYFVELREAGCYPKTVNALKEQAQTWNMLLESWSQLFQAVLQEKTFAAKSTATKQRKWWYTPKSLPKTW